MAGCLALAKVSKRTIAGDRFHPNSIGLTWLSAQSALILFALDLRQIGFLSASSARCGLNQLTGPICSCLHCFVEKQTERPSDVAIMLPIQAAQVGASCRVGGGGSANQTNTPSSSSRSHRTANKHLAALSAATLTGKQTNKGDQCDLNPFSSRRFNSHIELALRMALKTSGSLGSARLSSNRRLVELCFVLFRFVSFRFVLFGFALLRPDSGEIAANPIECSLAWSCT